MWTAFKDCRIKRNTYGGAYGACGGLSYKPSSSLYTHEKSILSAVINRIANEVSQIDFKHVRKDEEGRYVETINSNLNECLTVSANIDQNSRDFIRDVIISMCEEGNIAIFPTAVTTDINVPFDPISIRVGRITKWFPQAVEVEGYDECTGMHKSQIFPKKSVCILENPFYTVMNETNSSVQRLKKKLSSMDAYDKAVGSGKLDLIIQLPYALKSEARRKQAAERKEDIVKQLKDSAYGIAYVDNTEKITQLNRPLENNLLKEIEYLTNEVLSQLGFDTTILNGTADAQRVQNFKTTIINVYAGVIVDEMRRKWITKTGRSQGQDIEMYNDPFKLLPLEKMAELADKLTRNQIMTANEIRQKIGLKPSGDPKADMLMNWNVSHSPEEMGDEGGYPEEGYDEGYDEGYPEDGEY